MHCSCTCAVRLLTCYRCQVLVWHIWLTWKAHTKPWHFTQLCFRSILEKDSESVSSLTIPKNNESWMSNVTTHTAKERFRTRKIPCHKLLWSATTWENRLSLTCVCATVLWPCASCGNQHSRRQHCVISAFRASFLIPCVVHQTGTYAPRFPDRTMQHSRFIYPAAKSIWAKVSEKGWRKASSRSCALLPNSDVKCNYCPAGPGNGKPPTWPVINYPPKASLISSRQDLQFVRCFPSASFSNTKETKRIQKPALCSKFPKRNRQQICTENKHSQHDLPSTHFLKVVRV